MTSSRGLEVKLIPALVSSVDLGRAIREVERLDEFLYQSKIRSASVQTMPKTTQALEKLAEANGLSLLEAADRKQLIDDLKKLQAKGKKVHLSFAVEPSPAVVHKIVIWLRENIHAELIVDIGLQPNISVGCVLRTTNKVFDMSLRNRFKGSREMFSSILEENS